MSVTPPEKTLHSALPNQTLKKALILFKWSTQQTEQKDELMLLINPNVFYLLYSKDINVNELM